MPHLSVQCFSFPHQFVRYAPAHFCLVVIGNTAFVHGGVQDRVPVADMWSLDLLGGTSLPSPGLPTPSPHPHPRQHHLFRGGPVLLRRLRVRDAIDAPEAVPAHGGGQPPPAICDHGPAPCARTDHCPSWLIPVGRRCHSNRDVQVSYFVWRGCRCVRLLL